LRAIETSQREQLRELGWEPVAAMAVIGRMQGKATVEVEAHLAGVVVLGLLEQVGQTQEIQ